MSFQNTWTNDKSGWRGTWEMNGGGSIMNQGVHSVDVLLWLMGEVDRIEHAAFAEPVSAVYTPCRTREEKERRCAERARRRRGEGGETRRRRGQCGRQRLR